jgi:hypothetical protein
MAQIGTVPTFPPGRYGRRRSGRRTPRWAVVIPLAVVLLAALYLAVHLFAQYGDPAYQPTVTGYGQITDSSITVSFTVHERDPGPTTCQLEAKDYSAAQIGYAEVPVPAGSDVSVRFTLHTSTRPYAADILRCFAAK